MHYVTCLRTGQNDIRALTELEPERMQNVFPLLNMRGKNDRHLQSFLAAWSGPNFSLDISPYASDAQDVFLVERNLLSSGGGYQERRAFFREIRQENERIIPSISWKSNHPARDTTQFALRLEDEHPMIAIRPTLWGTDKRLQWARTKNILNAVADLERTWLFLDVGSISSVQDMAEHEVLGEALDWLQRVELAGVAILSTSFPQTKPANRTSHTIPCLDYAAQSLVAPTGLATELTYGDYAATNADGAMEYIAGMPVIPFASYLAGGEWWQKRDGADKEFSRYVDIAGEIETLAGYHGPDFCWANREMHSIALGQRGNGNNGIWNGFRINQHICGMLEILEQGGFPSAPEEADDEL